MTVIGTATGSLGHGNSSLGAEESGMEDFLKLAPELGEETRLRAQPGQRPEFGML